MQVMTIVYPILFDYYTQYYTNACAEYVHVISIKYLLWLSIESLQYGGLLLYHMLAYIALACLVCVPLSRRPRPSGMSPSRASAGATPPPRTWSGLRQGCCPFSQHTPPGKQVSTSVCSRIWKINQARNFKRRAYRYEHSSASGEASHLPA